MDTPPPLRFLVAESETASARDARRRRVGRSSGETYLSTLRSVAPGASFDLLYPTDAGAEMPGGEPLGAFDGVFITGSPLHLYEDTPEVGRQIEFMRAVFRSGTPSFGSCAGLQVATVAAGGTVRRNANGRELPIARRIAPTAAGARHPLLSGRPAAYDALTLHADEVEALPDQAVLLAANSVTAVQAAEIQYAGGVFWGVQYHPELPPSEVAGALRSQAESVVRQGLARDEAEVEAYAGKLAALGERPKRRDLAWQLGVDAQLTDPALRTLELRNFIAGLVRPTREARGRL